MRKSILAILSICGVVLISSASLAEEFVSVSFEFPNGKTYQTNITETEVRRILDRNIGYMVEWWVHGALSKLNLEYKEIVVNSEGALAVISIDGVANGENGSWVFYVNGFRSIYHINTQSREGVRNIRFVYEKKNHS